MIETSLEDWTYAEVARLVGASLDEIEPEDTIYDIGLQSILLMRLLDALRVECGVTVSYVDAIKAESLGALVSLTVSSMGSSEKLDQSKSETFAVSTVDDEGDDRPFGLSVMGHAYWAGRQDTVNEYGVPPHFYHEFVGENIDPERLGGALALLFERHPMLRASIDDTGRQRILSEPYNSQCTVHDFRFMPVERARRQLERVRTSLVNTTMDVAHGEVLAVHVTQLPGQCVLMVLLDMGVSDARSFRTLLAELARFYNNPDQKLPELRAKYQDYIAFLERSDPQKEVDRRWWQSQLPSLPRHPSLPLDVGGGTRIMRSYRLGSRLEPMVRRSLEEVARRSGVTLTVLLMSLFCYSVRAWSENERFLLNVPVFNRPAEIRGIDDVIGDFTGSVLLDGFVDPRATLLKNALAMNRRLAEALSHRRYSGVDVLRDLSQYHDEAVRAPVVFTSAMGIGELFSDEFKESLGRPSWIVSHSPYTWLDVQLGLVDGNLHINWDIRSGVFADGVAEEMYKVFERLLLDIASKGTADVVVDVLPPASQLEMRAVRQRAVDACAITRARAYGLLQDGLLSQARTRPDAIAVYDGVKKTTFSVLLSLSQEVAGRLWDAGVQPGDRVGVCVQKGVRQIAGVYGVLLAGCCYVPINPHIPEARKKTIARKATLSVVLAMSACDWFDGLVVHLPTGITTIENFVPVSGSSEDSAYVIFTSGSTGEPKGVEVSHAAALNTIQDIRARFDVGIDDIGLGVSNFDFDLSVFDLFGLLGGGASLVLVDQGVFADPGLWLKAMLKHRVTFWNSSPAQMSMLLDMVDVEGNAPTCLRVAMLSGDWVPADVADRIHRFSPNAVVAALGGATEAAIWSNVHVMMKGDSERASIPYGVSLTGQNIQVCDSCLLSRPDNVVGEICISGKSLAEGYFGQDDLTEEKFTYDDAGVRWYRTGDLGRWLPQGEIEFLGRNDDQIKIHGNRIEMAEVETVLTAHSSIAVAKVVAMGTKGNHYLAAAVVSVSGMVLDEEMLIEHQQGYLPAAAVCRMFIELNSLPLTDNGKVDVISIVRQCEASKQDDAVMSAPETSKERTVARAWCQVLNVESVNRSDSFFALGGDSLSATRMLVVLRGRGYAGSLANLFEHPTLKDFSRSLVSHIGREAPVTSNVEQGDANDPFELTSVQKAYLYGRNPSVELGGISCTFYREYLISQLDRGRLQRALDSVVFRHPMLHTKVEEDKQQVVDPIAVSVEEFDSRSAMAESLAHRVFNPVEPPLFAVGLTPDPDGCCLGIVFDNLVIDAASVLVLLADIDAAYADPLSLGTEPELTFRECVTTSLSTVKEPDEDHLSYWDGRLFDLPDAPALPTLVTPSSIGIPRFGRLAHTLTREQASRLTETCRVHHVTVASLLFCVYAETLRRYAGTEALTLTVTVFERPYHRDDIDMVVGDFTKLVLSSYWRTPAVTWEQAVRHASASLMADLDHCSEYAMQKVRSQLFQQGRAFPVVFTAALGLERDNICYQLFSNCVGGLSQTPQTWLDCQVSDFGDGGITTTWDYVEGLFPEGFLESAIIYYGEFLKWVLEADWDTDSPQPPVAVVKGAEGSVDTYACLHEGFLTHAVALPDEIALCREGEQPVTYAQLRYAADCASRYLDEANVLKGDTVVVTAASPQARVAMALALFSRAAVYVPASTDQASHRVQEICNLCQAKLVFGNKEAESLDMRKGASPIRGGGDPDAVAYIIFTSGTTGKPKGVKITHRQAMTTVNAIMQLVEGEPCIALSLAAPDFDLSIFDYFGVLGMGGTLVVPSGVDKRDSQTVARLVEKYGVTFWNSVPQMLQMTLESAEEGQLSSLRNILVSGDKVAIDLPGLAAVAAPSARFYSLGGATETSIWSNLFEPAHEPTWIEEAPVWASVPYGHPLPGQCYEVRSVTSGESCPFWTIGELVIGGGGVGDGYVADEPGFFEDKGVRLYRTGDLGRIRGSGLIEILGRRDLQVKVGGYRIELSEVEMHAEEMPGVASAVAGVTGDGKLGLALTREPQPVVEGLPRSVSCEVTATPGPSFLDETTVVRLIGDVLRRCDVASSRVLPSYQPLIQVWRAWLMGDGRDVVEGGLVDRRVRELANVLYDIVCGFKSADTLRSHSEFDVETQLCAAPDSATALMLMRSLCAGSTAIGAVDAGEMLISRCVDDVVVGRVPGANVRCLVETEAYDCLVAPFSLHRFSSRRQALARAHGALRSGGVLVMAEMATLSPAALCSAVVLSKGSINPQAIAEGTCTVTMPKVWIADAARMGLSIVSLQWIGDAIFVAVFQKKAMPQPEVLIHLRSSVPSSHIPTHLGFLDVLPLSQNGKVDRQGAMSALILPDEKPRKTAASDTERRVERIWGEALSSDNPLPVEENFFSLGGDSLGAARAAHLVQVQLCDSFSLRDFLDGPTIRAIAAHVESQNMAKSDFEEGMI